MGLLDFLFPPPPIDRFAQLFIQELRRAGITTELTYDKANGRIIRGKVEDASSIHLANFHQQYLSVPRRFRNRTLTEFVQGMILPDELPQDFDEARGNLRPKVWARAALEKSRLQIQIDTGDADKMDIPEYEIGSHLVASLVYDFPNSMRSISKDDLNKWGTTYYEALEIARENLDAVAITFAKIGDGCYASATGDSYDACRLLVPSLLERFDVKGDLVAMVPNRDTLLVCGAADDESLKIVLDLATKASEEARPLVPIPVCFAGGEWVDWLPPSGHPTYRGFRELAMRFTYQEYAEQKVLLEQIHEKDGTELFVASYMVVEKEDGTVLSHSVWTKGVNTLLPRTEWIIFGSVDEEDKGTAAIASWDRAVEILGPLMEPTNLYPERVRVMGYPTPKQLSDLGMATL